MRIGTYLSTAGGSPLQVGLERALKIHEIQLHNHYDLVLIFNQCAHTTNYEYKNLEQVVKKYPKIAFIDTAEYGPTKRSPDVIKDYYSTFAPGAMTHDTKNHEQQKRLFNCLNGKSFPYFLREFHKSFNFPKSYHPIDYPLYKHSECHSKPDENEYLARELELFVSWGLSNETRVEITKQLRECHRKCEIHVLEEVTANGITPRMAQAKYFNRTKSAKVSVSYDGYGSSSFREMEILCRCMLLKGEMTIKQRDPLINGVHFIEYNLSNLKELLNYYLDNPKEAFQIYKRGYEHSFAHYTEEATADYILKTVAKHDWSKPTPLILG